MDMNLGAFEMTSKAKILVLFANQYEINENGSHSQGCSVHYLFWGENGEPLFPKTEWNPDKPVGVQRAKCSIDYGLRNKLTVAPAIYEGSFEMKVGSDGKPVMRLVDVAYVSNVEFKAKVLPGFTVPGMVQPEPEQTSKKDK